MAKNQKITPKERISVCSKVCSEGFDYCFVNYSSFDNIKDKKFHELREAYIAAHNALAEYIDLDNYEEM